MAKQVRIIILRVQNFFTGQQTRVRIGFSSRYGLARTHWAMKFKKKSPGACPKAISYASRAGLKVRLVWLAKNADLVCVIVPDLNPGFWLDSVATRRQANSLCRKMGFIQQQE